MGHPKKLKKRYSSPSHPWQKSRIDEEKELTKNYGFKNKKEIWKMNSLLAKFKSQAKQLSADTSEQAKKETQQLFQKLKSLGLLEEESYDAVLEITLEQLVQRRLQSLLVARRLARSPRQARQFISHGHVLVNGKVITSPSHLIRVEEENTVGFKETSSLSKDDHPERFQSEQEQIHEEAQAVKPKEQE